MSFADLVTLMASWVSAWDCALAHPGGFERADFARFSCVHTSSADEAEYKLASINRREVFDSCKQYRAYISNSTT